MSGRYNTFKNHKSDCPCSFCRAKRGERGGVNHPMYGKPGPMTGKKHTKETKKKMREAHIGKKKPAGFGERMSKARMGKGNPMYGKKISPALRKIRSEARIKYMIEHLDIKPNKSEKRLDITIQKLLPGEYLLNVQGDVVIGRKIPDFVNINGQKKIIEFNGDYWHGPEQTGRTKEEEEKQRIDHFAKYGFQTLIIWEHELEDVKKLTEKVLLFNAKVER